MDEKLSPFLDLTSLILPEGLSEKSGSMLNLDLTKLSPSLTSGGLPAVSSTLLKAEDLIEKTTLDQTQYFDKIKKDLEEVKAAIKSENPKDDVTAFSQTLSNESKGADDFIQYLANREAKIYDLKEAALAKGTDVYSSITEATLGNLTKKGLGGEPEIENPPVSIKSTETLLNKLAESVDRASTSTSTENKTQITQVSDILSSITKSMDAVLTSSVSLTSIIEGGSPKSEETFPNKTVNPLTLSEELGMGNDKIVGTLDKLSEGLAAAGSGIEERFPAISAIVERQSLASLGAAPGGITEAVNRKPLEKTQELNQPLIPGGFMNSLSDMISNQGKIIENSTNVSQVINRDESTSTTVNESASGEGLRGGNITRNSVNMGQPGQQDGSVIILSQMLNILKSGNLKVKMM